MWGHRAGHYEYTQFRNQTVGVWHNRFLTADELEVTATLTKTVDKFARKIEQLAIIKEVGILVVLAGKLPSDDESLIQILLYLCMSYSHWSYRNNWPKQRARQSLP